jgi:ATP-binding cassette subfamily B protein
LDIWASVSDLSKVFFSSSVMALILWYGGYQVISGNLTIGELSAFGSLIAFVFNPLEALYDVVLNLQQSSASLARIFDILDLKPKVMESEMPVRVERIQGRIAFNNVGFHYDGNGFALRGINFTVSPGERLGVVGRTGAGKTTLMNLLLRFYDPEEGEIALDDIPLKNYAFESLRKNIAVVLQDIFFFEGSIAEAVALGKTSATRNEIENATKMARLDDLIQRLPQGYDTLIGEEGAKLSAGERQRLSLARAILKDAPILILDEATSSIDSQSEQAIEEALDHLLADRTTLVIAHRLSTLMRTDRVIYLDNGAIVDAGTPKEVLSRNPDFRILFQAQIDCMVGTDSNEKRSSSTSRNRLYSLKGGL